MKPYRMCLMLYDFVYGVAIMYSKTCMHTKAYTYSTVHSETLGMSSYNFSNKHNQAVFTGLGRSFTR